MRLIVRGLRLGPESPATALESRCAPVPLFIAQWEVWNAMDPEMRVLRSYKHGWWTDPLFSLLRYDGANDLQYDGLSGICAVVKSLICSCTTAWRKVLS